MARVKIIIEAEESAWQSYVAAINGDDGPSEDSTPEALTERETLAQQMLLANMARIAADHAVDRRVKAAKAQIEAGVEAQRQVLVASSLVSVEPVA